MGDSSNSGCTDWQRLVDVRQRAARNRLNRGDIAWLIDVAGEAIVAEVSTEPSRGTEQNPAPEKIAGGPLVGLSPKLTGG
jgi:hypothetical protein